MNSLAQVLLLYRQGLAVITSTFMIAFLAVEAAKAQPQPSCFMINTSGEVLNLEDICRVKPRGQLQSNAVIPINNALNTALIPERTEIPNRPVERVYFVGNGSVPFTLGTSSTTYYSGERPVYVRRYRQTQRFSTRDNARDALLRSPVNTSRVNISDRIPFIIYRYQK